MVDQPSKRTVAQAIGKWACRPFARGTADCCAFCDFVVHSISGKHYLPQYNDDESADRILNKHGGLEGAVEFYMGKPAEYEINPGDVVLLDVVGHEGLGILMDSQRVATVFEDGVLREVSAQFAVKGWSWA